MLGFILPDELVVLPPKKEQNRAKENKFQNCETNHFYLCAYICVVDGWMADTCVVDWWMADIFVVDWWMADIFVIDGWMAVTLF